MFVADDLLSTKRSFHKLKYKSSQDSIKRTFKFKFNLWSKNYKNIDKKYLNKKPKKESNRSKLIHPFNILLSD